MLVVILRVQFGNETFLPIKYAGFTFNVTKNLAGKLVAFGLFLSSVPVYAYMDVGKYYPEELKMDVYFDETAINETLDSFSEKDLSKIGFDRKRKYDSTSYYLMLDNARKEVTGLTNGFFAENRGIYSTGRTTFVTEKVSGFQNYRLNEVIGSLTHEIVRSDGETDKFITHFSHRPSYEDRFEPTLKEILWNRKFVVAPKFNQSITSYDNRTGQKIDHELVGLTKVTIWPVPSYGNTVYFYRNDSGALVPVGIAVYQ